MRKSPLRAKGNSELSKCKDRIQKLLTMIVRKRDGECVFAPYPETGACSGPTAADHIISRARAATYGDLRNVICVCQRHHIYWKPQNPVMYVDIVKGIVDWEWIEKAEKDRGGHNFTLWDWQKIEMNLIQELKKYENIDRNTNL